MIDEPASGHSGAVVHPEARLKHDGSPPFQSSVGLARPLHLRALVDEQLDFVWRSLRRLGLSAADADDATQQVFMVASRKLDCIEPGAERAFLFGVARRITQDLRRGQRRKPSATADGDVDVPDSSPDPEELTAERRTRALLDAVLAEMPDETRSVFVLFELEELPAPEIAVLLDIPVGTVASRLRRGRELFRAAAARLRAREAFRGGTP